MYGSSLRLVTRTPREARIAASDAAAMPFPNEETTPPVTNTNLVMGDKFRKLSFYRKPAGPTNPVAAKLRRSRRAVCWSSGGASSLLACGRQTRFNPPARRVAAEQREHRVDRRRLARAAGEHPERHHHLRRLELVRRRHRLDQRADRFALPLDRCEFAGDLVEGRPVAIVDEFGDRCGRRLGRV